MVLRSGARQDGDEGKGKRAAIALFWALLHFLFLRRVTEMLGPPPQGPALVELGDGTGVAGIAWRLASPGTPSMHGIDRHPWAVSEARWNLAFWRISGEARRLQLQDARSPRRFSRVFSRRRGPRARVLVVAAIGHPLVGRVGGEV